MSFDFRIAQKDLNAMADGVIATPRAALQVDGDSLPLATAILFMSVLLGRHRQAFKIMRAHPELVSYPLDRSFSAGADIMDAAGQQTSFIYLLHMQAATMRVDADEKLAYDMNTRFILRRAPLQEPGSEPGKTLEQAIKMAERNGNTRFLQAVTPCRQRVAEQRDEDRKLTLRIAQRDWRADMKRRKIKSPLNFFAAAAGFSVSSLGAAKRPVTGGKIREATTDRP